MRKFLKQLTYILLSGLLMLGISTPVFAAEGSDNNASNDPIGTEVLTTTDLNTMDLSQPFSQTESYTDENGTPVVVTVSYMPAVQTRGSKTATATSGTWTSRASYGVISMSYQFYLSKSSSQWHISNARNLSYSGILCSFSNPSLYISRATSSSSTPAEVNGSVTAKTAVNSSVCLLTTKVSHGGTVTTIWN